MGSKQESLNKRIRETVTGLSDEDLVAMLKASTPNYTPFARQVAQEELSRRRQMTAIQEGASPVRNNEPGVLSEVSVGVKRAGCYIEVWSEKDFEGEHLRIEGPVECQALRFATLNWGGSISSLRVGPSAFVLVYADEDFEGAMLSFGPGQEVPNLEELRFNDEIDSIRLVNSMKIFDGLRVEEARKPVDQFAPSEKQQRGAGRRKKRGGRIC